MDVVIVGIILLVIRFVLKRLVGLMLYILVRRFDVVVMKFMCLLLLLFFLNESIVI